MTTTLDYYALLGIPRSASASEIKTAYRKMVFRYHPDRNPEDGSAAEKLSQVLEAYETLSNSAKRALYDKATRPAFDQEGEEPPGRHERGGDEPFGDGFRFSHEFRKQVTPEPKCPRCSVVGTDYIVSRKGGGGGARGKQFILSPFSIIFCSECGHVYGVTATSV